jgi:prepilin-type N-terminal cleavage/methylation domain-containing protein
MLATMQSIKSSTRMARATQRLNSLVMANNQGLSFIELVISLAIIGILSGAATIHFLQYAPRNRLNGATRHLAWNLMAARMQAIRDKHNITVTFTDDHHYVIWTDKNDDDNIDTDEEITKDLHDFYHDVHVSSTTNPTFTPTGSMTNPPSITLTNASGTRSIATSAAGLITFE